MSLGIRVNVSNNKKLYKGPMGVAISVIFSKQKNNLIFWKERALILLDWDTKSSTIMKSQLFRFKAFDDIADFMAAPFDENDIVYNVISIV